MRLLNNGVIKLSSVSIITNIIIGISNVNNCNYTLKTPGSEIDPERVHWGQTPFRVNDDPEISQLDAECDPELGHDSQVCNKLTNFRVIMTRNGVWPQWTLFRVTLTRVF